MKLQVSELLVEQNRITVNKSICKNIAIIIPDKDS